jgi:hypothetical protein
MSAARKTDPTTSKTAARIDAVVLEGLRHTIYTTLARRPKTGFADHELVDALAGRVQRTPQRIRTARAELTKLGLVELNGTQRPTPTGYKADVWVVA